MLITLLAAILPVPLFYLIYYRHFSASEEKRENARLKHLEAFLGGIAAALAIILLSPFIGDMLSSESVFFQGFVRAALVEKLAAMIVIALVRGITGFHSHGVGDVRYT
jgi:Kef-type K+ transport system membrane component KefB